MNHNVGIIGIGVMGNALSKVLDNPILYDPPKGIGSIEELNKSDIVFLCVPTPYNNGFDLSCVENAISKLEGNKVIVIKSTVIPGTTNKLQGKYPNHRFLFNPEFLTEKNAENDMEYPSRQIMGYTNKSESIARDIISLLPRAPFERIMPAKEAEMIKYAANSFLAIKVGFANQIYDLCQKLGIDYELVKWGIGADPRIGNSHLDIWHDGERGYSGKCFPKDTKSLIDFAEQLKVNISILKATDKYNERIKK